ncbi:MAG: bifunctional biotin--[acetyl-CoA-carboxylase] ligase/biotin operon repressor BirA [Gammaproteobacteria bacterium]
MPGLSHSTHAILRALADGQFQSGEQLAWRLDITRAAVWKHVRQLTTLGLEVVSVPGRGYRLARPIELLDDMRLRALLAPACREGLCSLTVLDTVGSTNTWLMSQPGDFPAVCLAELQTAGRGRRGRQWISPFAANLYLSLGWQFDDLPPGFTALGMVAAISVVRALHRLHLDGIAIKWPNDLMAADRKLGGILVDMQGEPSGRVRTVTGIGVNVRMPDAAAACIDQPWTDLARLTHDALPDRDRLAAALIEELMTALQLFTVQGFAAFAAEWRALDCTAGRAVNLKYQRQTIHGTALGVDQDGALLLHTESGTHRFVSGDISLRMRP